ncbi:MAG: hypothetical protein J0M12_07420 [Deltaproteobacteria bacterium]|nr:hypothetical protein [Deltaproteobacteria bacterium]
MGFSIGYKFVSGSARLAAALLVLAYASLSNADYRADTLAASTYAVQQVAPAQGSPSASAFRADSVNPASKNDSARDLSAPIAGKRAGFFEPGVAKTVFQDKAKLNKKPKVEYFNAIALSKEEEEVPAEAALKKEEEKKKELNTPEDIEKEYGNWNEDEKILAQDSAPAPFKAMMAAMQIGDEELGFKYARKYVRYLRDMRERATDSVGMIGKAMELEKMLPPGSWADSEQFDKAERLKRNEIKEAGLEDRESTRIAKLDSKTKAMLDRAQEAEEMEANPKQPEAQQAPALSEQAQRAEYRRALSGKVPVDPKGQVDVYFFFRANDAASLEMVPEVEAFYRAVALKAGVNFIASPLESMSPDVIRAFREQTNSSFPIKNGQRLVRELGVKSTPTLVFISPSTAKAVIEEGKRSFLYLDELSKMMRGQ